MSLPVSFWGLISKVVEHHSHVLFPWKVISKYLEPNLCVKVIWVVNPLVKCLVQFSKVQLINQLLNSLLLLLILLKTLFPNEESSFLLNIWISHFNIPNSLYRSCFIIITVHPLHIPCPPYMEHLTLQIITMHFNCQISCLSFASDRV